MARATHFQNEARRASRLLKGTVRDQPMALAVPTHLNNEAWKASRLLNTLGAGDSGTRADLPLGLRSPFRVRPNLVMLVYVLRVTGRLVVVSRCRIVIVGFRAE